MEHFNYYFDIASIFIFASILYIYRQQNLINNTAKKVFMALWTVSFITPFADILSVVSLDIKSPFIFHFSNTTYYLGLQWTAFFFFLYACVPLTRREKINKIQRLSIGAPIIIISLVILSNPITKCLYSYDFVTDVYSYSPYQFLCYVPSLLYYLHALYFVVSRKDVYNKSLRSAIISTFILVGTAVGLQAIFSKYLLHSFAISLTLLQILAVTIQQGITFDPRTKLLSKNAFYDRINSLIYNKIPFNAVTIRMADYEVVLSTYGLNTLEGMEEKICENLHSKVPPNSCYKLADDVWTILYEKQTVEDNQHVEEQINELLSHKYVANGLDISFTYFVVTFKYPDHFKSIAEFMGLIVYLQKTKRMRYGIMPVEEFVIRDLHREQDVEYAITDAIKNHLFEMYYQPIYDTALKSFTSSEALIRLNNSSIGPIGPSEFIPIAEKTGQIIQIGDYVLRDVCRFIKETDLKSLGIEYIEVNLSAIQCLQRNFISSLKAIIKEYGVDPALICFEITETASNCAPDIFLSNLNELHELGFKLALDDFGTGYGNLQRLISLPFDYVKFDNYTTARICSEEKLRNLFPKLINMIRSMDAKIVCEGVETKEQLDFLVSLTVDYIQGYYFSTPVNETQYINYSKEKNN